MNKRDKDLLLSLPANVLIFSIGLVGPVVLKYLIVVPIDRLIVNIENETQGVISIFGFVILARIAFDYWKKKSDKELSLSDFVACLIGIGFSVLLV